MPAIADVVLADSGTVNRTFVPTDIRNGIAKWQYAPSGSVLDAYRTITLSHQMPAKGSSVRRAKIRVGLPVMDAVDATKKIGEGVCNIEFVLPKGATDTNLNDLHKFAKNFMANVFVETAVRDAMSPY